MSSSHASPVSKDGSGKLKLGGDDLFDALSECSQLDSSLLDLPPCDVGDNTHRDGAGHRDVARRPLLDRSDAEYLPKHGVSFKTMAKKLPRKERKTLLQKSRRLELRVAKVKLKSKVSRSRFGG